MKKSFLLLGMLASMAVSATAGAEHTEHKSGRGNRFASAAYFGGVVGFAITGYKVDEVVGPETVERTSEPIPISKVMMSNGQKDLVEDPTVQPHIEGVETTFDTTYDLSYGSGVGSTGQVAVDAVIGKNFRLGNCVFGSAEFRACYKPNTVNTDIPISADPTTVVTTEAPTTSSYRSLPFSWLPVFTNSSVVSSALGANSINILDVPESTEFSYAGGGNLQIALHNNWNINFLLGLSWAHPSCVLGLKLGYSMGFYSVDGSIDTGLHESINLWNQIVADATAFYTTAGTFSLLTDYDAVSEPVDLESTHRLFSGFVLVPYASFPINDHLQGIVEAKWSIYGKNAIATSFTEPDSDESDDVTFDLHSLGSMELHVGLLYNT